LRPRGNRLIAAVAKCAGINIGGEGKFLGGDAARNSGLGVELQPDDKRAGYFNDLNGGSAICQRQRIGHAQWLTTSGPSR
jgi:hypothetical protein